MVRRDSFRMLNKEELQYKFKFCELCEFYECELIKEYMQFKEAHIEIPNSKNFKDSGDTILQGNAIMGEICEKDTKNAELTKKQIIVSATNSSSVPISDVQLLSYDQGEWKNGCIMNFPNVNQVECGEKYVTNGIGDHYKIETEDDYKIKTNTEDRWEPSQPVFISAQTGSGKNTFVEDALIPYVRDLNYKKKTNQKVLILSNRLALKRQIENRLKGEDDSDNEESEIYPYDTFADVMTYQSLLMNIGKLARVQKNNRSMYIYVVCDEAHFFTSDAMFNPHTQKILSSLVKIFKDATRIYMSATPYECLEYIIECEKKFNPYYNTMVFYHFKRDYSYLDINTYSDINELYDVIVRSVNNKKEKWLIFIDDKEKCQSVKENLIEYGKRINMPMFVETENTKIDKIYAVSANSKEDKTYMSIVRNQKLDRITYVLISTSVLDNGVNLEGIDNIVISDMSKVKSLQMVGRARMAKGDNRKTLYIKKFDEKYVNKRLAGFYKQQDAYHSYDLAYADSDYSVQPNVHYYYSFFSKYYNGDEKDWKNAKHWFGISSEEPGKLYFNEIAKSLLDKLISQYEFILDEMKRESKKEESEKINHDSKSSIGQKYLEYQLSLFGKKYYAENSLTVNNKTNSVEELMNFLKSHAVEEKQMNKKEQEHFRKQFTMLYDAAFQRLDPNKERDYGINIINKALTTQNIGYIVTSTTVKGKTYWMVEKNKKCEYI